MGKRKQQSKRVDVDSGEVKRPEGRAPGIVEIGSLEELEAICTEVLHLRMQMNGKTISIPVRRLTPAESEKIELILAEAHPPTKKNEQGEIVFDIADAGYRKVVAEKQKVARAVAVYMGCPLFHKAEGLRMKAEGNPTGTGTLQREEIVAFVQGKLTDAIHEEIYRVCRSEDLVIEGRVNFS
jgi:hypothetical protein